MESIGEPKMQLAGANPIMIVPVKLSGMAVNIQFSFNDAGQIAGMFLRPAEQAPAKAWERPAYSKPESFKERDLTAGAEGRPLGATLTVPAGKGPFPAILLVHGSGPHDRNESIGPNKPFRDLVEELASQDVAVSLSGYLAHASPNATQR